MTWCCNPGVQSNTERSRKSQTMIRHVRFLMTGCRAESGQSCDQTRADQTRIQVVTGHAWNTIYHLVFLQQLHLLLMYWPNVAKGESGPCVRSLFSYSFSSFLHDTFSQTSPNFDKTKINTNWDRYERPLSNPQNFQNNLPLAIVLSRKIGNKRVKEQHVATQ